METKYKFSFDQLGLGCTGRCNMHPICEHCLRGAPVNADMSEAVVDKILDSTYSIGSVTFSGGEPALNLPIIRYFLEGCKKRSIPISGFYVATNGLVNQMELAHICLDLAVYCDDPDYCGVCCSTDIYHNNDKEAQNSPLRFLSFYDHSKENGDYMGGKAIIQRGNAASADFDGGRKEDPCIELSVQDIVEEDGVKILYLEDMFYVSHDGTVCADCDLSYDMMHDYGVGDVDHLQELAQELEEEYEEN